MNQVVPLEVEVRERKRGEALLKAIGLDRVPAEQREIALAIAKRYDLDLLLKHLVLVDGRPYITRDGLLHIAHRSGVFDGIEVSEPILTKLEGQGDFWTARATVYRKDMSRPFAYPGRYPARGGNQRYAPEMAVKVAEVMALRRAFDVSAPVIEDDWDVNTEPMEAVAPLSERIKVTRAAIEAAGPSPEPVASEGPSPDDHPAQAGAPRKRGRSERASAEPASAQPRGAEPAHEEAVSTTPAEAAPGVAAEVLDDEPSAPPPGVTRASGTEEDEEVAARPLPECLALPPRHDPLGLAEGGPCQLRGFHRAHRNDVGSWPAS